MTGEEKFRTKSQRVRDLRLLASQLAGRRVNLTLKDGSVIVNVLLAPFEEKHSIRYRLTTTGKFYYLPLSSVELITTLALEAQLLAEDLEDGGEVS